MVRDPLGIRTMAEQVKDEVVAWRREIHQHPELGFQEFKTSTLVTKVLEDLGLEVNSMAPTGVVALLKGSKPGKTIALRSDMDALPIHEDTGESYASSCPGVMHACGHDAHTAILLGTAKVLTEIKDRLVGQVKFIFQPCEEGPPGGAEAMIQQGVMENPKVDGVVGLHSAPYLPVGFIGVKEGPTMAASDGFNLTIIGKGGHGATPHLTVDPIVVAAQVILALQSIPSRRIDPLEPIVITIGQIQGGHASNVIPEQVYLSGTVRTLNEELRKNAPQLIEQTVRGITEAYGATYKLDYQIGYPVVINEPRMVKLVEKAGFKVLGDHKVLPIPRPTMGGEDFSFYAQRVPGCFFFLGVGRPGEPVYPWHHPKFNLAEEAMVEGVAVLCQTAVDFLSDQG